MAHPLKSIQSADREATVGRQRRADARFRTQQRPLAQLSLTGDVPMKWGVGMVVWLPPEESFNC